MTRTNSSFLETLIVSTNSVRKAHIAKVPSQRAATSQRILELASNLEKCLSESVEDFVSLNIETKFVALNARIEAGRAGGNSGRAFDVVAQSIQDISTRTGKVADDLSEDFSLLLKEMREITEEIAVHSRGERLSNLALTNIDLIDRNLYERSCDVRWWATDQSFVDALVEPDEQRLSYAIRRMSQILESYTVYFDIVITDLDGRVLANGRPETFRSIGTSQAGQQWFNSALQTTSGAEYVQSAVAPSSLCSNERAMIFACMVRREGRANGDPVGVLAVVFRWDALAQTVVQNTPLSTEECERTRVCIVDSHGNLLADTTRDFGNQLMVPMWDDIRKKGRGYRMVSIDNLPHCIGHAASPGFETYRTGWYSLLVQGNSSNK